MKNFTFILALPLTLSLTACGIAAKVNARNDMLNSRDAYKACLAAHPDTIKACESARLTYEADAQAYTLTSGGLDPNGSKNVSIIHSHY